MRPTYYTAKYVPEKGHETKRPLCNSRSRSKYASYDNKFDFV